MKSVSDSWGTDLPFSHESVVSITHENNIICSKTLICGQLYVGHVVGSRPMKRNEKMYGSIRPITRLENHNNAKGRFDHS